MRETTTHFFVPPPLPMWTPNPAETTQGHEGQHTPREHTPRRRGWHHQRLVNGGEVILIMRAVPLLDNPCGRVRDERVVDTFPHPQTPGAHLEHGPCPPPQGCAEDPASMRSCSVGSCRSMYTTADGERPQMQAEHHPRRRSPTDIRVLWRGQRSLGNDGAAAAKSVCQVPVSLMQQRTGQARKFL